MYRKSASYRVGKPGVLLGLSSKCSDQQRKAEVENESKKKKKIKDTWFTWGRKFGLRT